MYMLSIQETREYLGDMSSALSDEEVVARRDFVYALAGVFVSTYLDGRESDTPRE